MTDKKIEPKDLDEETIYWGTNDELLSTIHERRQDPETVSHEEVGRLLNITKKR